MSTSSRRPPPPVEDDNPPRPRRADGASALAEAALHSEAQASARLDGETVDVGPVQVAGERPLAGLLGGPQQGSAGQVLDALVELRRKQVDPMADYVPDGTRFLRFIQDTVAHQASLLRVRQQELVRDVMLGRRSLDPALLDAHYKALYGHERP